MKLNNIINITLFAILLANTNASYAQNMKVELGWGNITPCSRVTWVDSSIPGIKAPKVEMAEQRLHAYANVSAMTSSQDVFNYIQQCAVRAATVAGLSAIFASPAAAMPAFESEFSECLGNIGSNVIDFNLSVEPECLWN